MSDSASSADSVISRRRLLKAGTAVGVTAWVVPAVQAIPMAANAADSASPVTPPRETKPPSHETTPPSHESTPPTETTPPVEVSTTPPVEVSTTPPAGTPTQPVNVPEEAGPPSLAETGALPVMGIAAAAATSIAAGLGLRQAAARRAKADGPDDEDASDI